MQQTWRALTKANDMDDEDKALRHTTANKDPLVAAGSGSGGVVELNVAAV